MFQLLATDPASKARLGTLQTSHGIVETPVFMPVGTQGTVKSVSPDELRAMDAQIILGNTYHLWLRPGTDVIDRFGSLHAFSTWDRAILTDSGGYQVFSLSKLRKISEDGVSFQSHLDGHACFLGPEESMRIQDSLGSDIVMLFDECPPYPCDHEYAARSLERTTRWAARCLAVPTRGKKFGIVQGSVYPDLRRASAEALVALELDGYAIGGVSVGEPEHEMMAAVEHSEPFLPANKARYAMGLGKPHQIVELVARGVDMFDCVLPTRVARNGTAFVSTGTLNLKNAAHRLSDLPIEEGCKCPACGTFSRAYLRHLVKANEILGLRLLTLHNLHFYLNLMRQIRAAIAAGTFASFRRDFQSKQSRSSADPQGN